MNSPPTRHSRPISAPYASQVILYEPTGKSFAHFPFTLFPFAQPFLNVSSDLAFDFPLQKLKTHSYGCGQILTPHRLRMPSCRTAVVIWEPLAFGLLCGGQAEKFTNRVFSLKEVSPRLEKKLLLDIRESTAETAIESMVNTINSFHQETWESDTRLLESWKLILQTKGEISNSQLAFEVGLSERRIQQLFKNQVGTTPKKIRKIIRFQYYMQSLVQSNYSSGLRDDYYDDAHFIRDLKKHSGMTPQLFNEYLKQYATSNDVGGASPFG